MTVLHPHHIHITLHLIHHNAQNHLLEGQVVEVIGLQGQEGHGQGHQREGRDQGHQREG